MKRTIFFAGLSGCFLTSFFIYSQSQNLQPIESYAFAQTGKTITARDNSIGLLYNEPSAEMLLREFLNSGPDVDYYDKDIYQLLKMKHDLFPVREDSDFKIRLSNVTEEDNRKESRFLITGNAYKIKGTIYLAKDEEKWFLSDIELEN